MNWDIVEGKWNEYKGKAQAQWGKLTNDDLDVIEGRRDELAGKIQARYGKTRDEAERFIADDPFSRVELFERVTITHWRKAYLAGRCFL